jgi:hypothetical protein
MKICKDEIWKDIVGYPDYKVSNYGNVKSIPLKRNLLQACTRGYMSVSFNRKYKKRHHLVHRLVAEAFMGKSHLEVNHKNGIKHDNRLENLEFVTRKENMQHAFKSGLVSSAKKLSNTLVTFIRIYCKKYTQREVSKMFCVSETTIHEIIKGKTWNSEKQKNK